MADAENIIHRHRRERAQRKWKRARRTKWILLTVLAVVLIAAAAIGYFGAYLPYALAENTMPQNGSLLLELQEDGTILLTWSVGWNADYYIVQILPAQEEGKAQEAPLYTAIVENGESCILTELPQDQELTLQVQSAKRYKVLWQNRVRLGNDDLQSSGYFPLPTVANITWQTDPDEDFVDIRYDLADGVLLQMCLAKNEDEERWFQVLNTEQVRYTFGDDGDYPVPGYGESYDFICRPYLYRPGLEFFGLETTPITLMREDFLGTVLKAQYQYLGYNQYTLTWNETKGDYYEVQQYDREAEEWVTVSQVFKGEALTYTTPHLQRYEDFQFRIVALENQPQPDSDYVAVSNEIEVMTGASLIYSTIWPIKNLDVYSDTDQAEVIGTAPGGTAYCVLAESDGLFRIRFQDGYGYIDSNYCMINLPEYIGSLCSYNITNSYDSLYMVHGYEIPEVTGQVILGYEDVQLDDGTFLAPLLYPTAKKLEQAAFVALDAGLRIKIYDSYRPQEATQSIYNIAKAIYQNPLPDEPYSRDDPEEDAEENPEETLPPPEEPPVEPEEPAVGEEPVEITYRELMTDNGRYSLDFFLANTTSYHNLGIAMDMTLEWVDSEEELEMQTDMHDLSYFSELANNNSEANWLSSIMTNAGFGGLVSEWWHFQDNDARRDLSLTPLWTGVSLQCWMADDNGWRYRTAGGNYYTNGTRIIDGHAYSFDADGYVIEGTPKT